MRTQIVIALYVVWMLVLTAAFYAFPAGPAAVLGLGTIGLLASDVLYGLGRLEGSWQIGSSYDLGWVLFYIAWGAAALHPSMAALAVPVHQPSGRRASGASRCSWRCRSSRRVRCWQTPPWVACSTLR
jgi:hypothetical protein